jgi:protocatechuate 3,4-dioxygenase alpha subunit
MNTLGKRIPSSSQTVGPYFRIGLDYLIDRMNDLDVTAKNTIEIRGRILDGDGVPVPDAMLEFWSAENVDSIPEHGIPDRFRRVRTDLKGCYAARVKRPVAMLLEDGRLHAPHIMVLVFARGLMRHLISRVYLEGEAANQNDTVLLNVPVERRGTLLAEDGGENEYRWDIVLQGNDETVFFAW